MVTVNKTRVPTCLFHVGMYALYSAHLAWGESNEPASLQLVINKQKDF